MVPPKPPRFATARLLWRLGMVAIGIFLGSSLGGVLGPQKTAGPLEDLRPAISRLADAAVAPQLPALLSQMRAQLNTNLGHGELLSLLAAGLKDPDLIQLSRLPLSGDQAARRLDQIRAEPLLELWHQAQAPSANNPQVNVEGIELTLRLSAFRGRGWRPKQAF